MPLHVALIQPQIPPNTGNIARLCAATDTSLHLIEPLGFSIDSSEVRRAGLDYWDAVDLWVHPDWFAFRDAILEKHPEQCFTIPMMGPVRNLNLSNAVSIVLYEAIRQLGS
jgi:tRNA (cytidine/uridine-2'-O-)-methyltransferase